MKTFSFKIAFFESYKFLFNNISLLIKSSFIVALIYAFLEYKLNAYVGDIHIHGNDNMSGVALVGLMVTMIQIVLITMFLVPWGGYYLKHIPTINLGDVLNWHNIKTDYLIANIKIIAMFFGVSSVAIIVFLIIPKMLSYFVIPAGVILLAVFSARVLFILPSAIDGNKSKISDAWNLTKNNAVKILGSLIGVSLPFLLISALIITPLFGVGNYGYAQAFIVTILIFISQAISTVFYINVYKQLSK